MWRNDFDFVPRKIKKTNGNCGWGFSNNWINPSSNKCEGQYAYNDKTCDEACIVVEGIYWASVSYMGGLYTTTNTQDIQNEWLMATPDAGMKVHPTSVNNAISLQSGAPALYDLVSDTTSEGHAWLPSIMPDGKYKGFDDNVGNNPNDDVPDDDPVSCEDDAKCKFEVELKKGTKLKKCKWVKKNLKRCKKKTPEGQQLSKVCPTTCGAEC